MDELTGLRAARWTRTDRIRRPFAPQLVDRLEGRAMPQTSFLSLPGIEGTVTVEGFQGQIEVSEFSFNASNPIPDTGTGHPRVSDLQIVAPTGPDSAELLRDLLSGQSLGTAVLTVVRIIPAGVEQIEKITLDNASVVSYTTDQSLTDRFTISYDRFKFETSGTAEGGTIVPGTTATWDRRTGAPFAVTGVAAADPTTPSSVGLASLRADAVHAAIPSGPAHHFSHGVSAARPATIRAL